MRIPNPFARLLGAASPTHAGAVHDDAAESRAHKNERFLEQAAAWRDEPHAADELRAEAYEQLRQWVEAGRPQNALQLEGQWLRQLPPLPDNLVRLVLRDQCVQTPPHLPDGLRSIYLHGVGLTDEWGLPSDLMHLTIERELTDRLPPLPATLQQLVVSDNERLITIGPDALPNLKDLTVEGNARMRSIQSPMPNLTTALVQDNGINDVTGLTHASNLQALNLSRNRFTQFPEAFFGFVSCPYIEFEDNPASAHVIAEVVQRCAQPDYNGPTVYCSIHDDTTAWDERPLHAVVREWNRGAQHELPDWTRFDEQPHAVDFAHFLHRLGRTINAGQTEFRGEVRDWLRELSDRPALREAAFAAAHDASSTCEDRVTWVYNKMHVARAEADVTDGVYNDRWPALVELARGLFRIETLERIADDKIKSMTGVIDEIEVTLGYQVKLRDAPELPTAAAHMRYFEHWSGLNDADLAAAKHQVQVCENRDFASYFAQWRPWHDALEKTHPQALHDARQRLYDRMDNGDFERELNAKLAAIGLAEDDDARRTQGAELNKAFHAETYMAMTRQVLRDAGCESALEPRWALPTPEQRVEAARTEHHQR